MDKRMQVLLIAVAVVMAVFAIGFTIAYSHSEMMRMHYRERGMTLPGLAEMSLAVDATWFVIPVAVFAAGRALMLWKRPRLIALFSAVCSLAAIFFILVTIVAWEMAAIPYYRLGPGTERVSVPLFFPQNDSPFQYSWLNRTASPDLGVYGIPWGADISKAYFTFGSPTLAMQIDEHRRAFVYGHHHLLVYTDGALDTLVIREDLLASLLAVDPVWSLPKRGFFDDPWNLGGIYAGMTRAQATALAPANATATATSLTWNTAVTAVTVTFTAAAAPGPETVNGIEFRCLKPPAHKPQGTIDGAPWTGIARTLSTVGSAGTPALPMHRSNGPGR